MLVQDIMQSAVVTTTTGARLTDAYQTMLDRGVRHLPVMDDDTLVGVITDRDLRHATSDLHPSPLEAHAPVHTAMTADPFTAGPLDPVEEVARILRSKRIGCMPVLDGETLVGIVTVTDLLDAVTPKAVIVSSAYESRYGHPHEEALGRLADRSLPTYWTATHGNIVLASDGHSVTIRTQRAAPTAPLDLREAPGIAPGSDDDVGTRETIGGEVVPPAEPPLVADGGTPVGDQALALTWVNADAEGDDRENLNGEYLVFRNMWNETLNLTGWTVTDTAGNRYTAPAGVTLEADATVTLHTGSGTDTEDHLYWGSRTPVWNNGGDTVTLRNDTGTVVLEETYE
jgi:CBS domain-containing protein